MPIYEYETVPTKAGEVVKRYEIRQCMDDEPLTQHPETGESIRRVYSTFAVSGGGSGHGHSHGHGHGHGHGGGHCGCGGCCGGH